MAEMSQLEILTIAAHPDDAEITCGGLLIKMAQRGHRTGVLDLTAGEAGTCGDEHDRAREAAEAAEVMGLTYRGNVGLPDAAVAVSQESKLAVAARIRTLRPEMVILPHWAQRHPDHAVGGQLGYAACFLAGLKKIDLPGEPHRPRKIIYASYFRNYDHSFLVDISDVFEQKLKAVAAYRSQFGDALSEKKTMPPGRTPEVDPFSSRNTVFSSGVGIHDFLYTQSHYLGQLVGVRFAEAYTIKEPVLVDDPLKLPGRSI